jgi:hypothetical protein
MGQLDKTTFLEQMKQLLKAIEQDDKNSRLLYEYCGGVTESWAIDTAVNILDSFYSPQTRWISWWVFDNDCGKGKLQAWLDGTPYPTKTLDDLWNLVCGDDIPTKV